MKTILFAGSIAALAIASSTAVAHGPFAYGAHYGGWGSSCGAGCYAEPGCCERPISKYDHVWDNYCREKWCPTVHCDRLRPWWHGAPAVYGTPAAGCTGPSCGTPVGSNGTPASYSPAVVPVVTPLPTPASPSPAAANELNEPPMPPSAKPNAEDAIELKLLPLSRPRSTQP